MEQEVVRENNKKQFINSAATVNSVQAEGLSNAKEALLGSKSRYIFTCQSCKKNSVTSVQEYESTEGAIKEGVRREVNRSIQRELSSVLRSIPYIGYFLSNILYSATSKYNSSKASNNNTGKLKAFEEVEPKFHRCESCGSYLCSACRQEGTCSMCNPKS